MNKAIKNTSSKNIILAIVFVIYFLSFRYNSFTAPFERDEGEYAYSAWIMRQGIMPYENSFMQKPPMIIYTYALGQVFDPEGIVSPRILSSLFILVTTILLGLISNKKFGSPWGWITMFLVTPMIMLPINAPFAANTEHFLTTPLVGVIAIYYLVKDKYKLWHFIVAGILSAISLMYKPIGLPVFILVYLVWIFKIYKTGGFRLLIKNVLVTALSFGVTMFAILLPFILTNTLSKLLESAFFYNLSYTDFEGFGFSNFVNFMFVKYLKVYWPIYVFTFFSVFKRSGSWWIWTGLFFCSLLSVYSSPMGHYYIMVMPFWALLAISGMKNILEMTKNAEKYANDRIWGLLVLTLVIVIYPFRMQFGLTPDELSLWIYGTVNPFKDAYVVSQEIAKITKGDDYIFVAGSEPEIYFYSKRLSPTRFVITYPLNITSKYREEYQTELVNDLKSNPPKIIAVSNMEHSGLWNEGSPRIFIDYLLNILKTEYNLQGGYLKFNDKGAWVTNLEKNELINTSLLVYIRKE